MLMKFLGITAFVSLVGTVALIAIGCGLKKILRRQRADRKVRP